MSVIYFTDNELKNIYEKLKAIVSRDDFSIEISEEKLWLFMVRLGLYNRFAYGINYHRGNNDIKLKIPDLETTDFEELTLKKLIEKLGMLEYNCITNSGRCFMDSKDSELLKKLVDSLQIRYIKELERK